MGDWFTAAEVDIDSLNSLNDNYMVFNWNISPNTVTDGFYELRSVVTCSGITLMVYRRLTAEL